MKKTKPAPKPAQKAVKPRKVASLEPEKLKVDLKRVLVPLDFSDNSLKALKYAVALTKEFKAELTVLHVVEQMVYAGDWMYPTISAAEWAGEKREQVLKTLRQFTSPIDGKVKHVVRLGRAWQEIVDVAKEMEAELLIITTHGYTGLKHALLGSVTEKVIRHAPCPVLTVRADERDFV